MAWITPKTNWKNTDKFAYTDYNRIRNNLLFINDMLNERYPDKAQTLDLGSALSYSANYLPSQFNAFENALESFTRIGSNVNIGSKKTFKGNDAFIGYQELNRIEECCLRWYNYDPVIHVDSISISPTTQIITIGESQTFTVTCLPVDAEDKTKYVVSSSNPSVLTVSKNGMNVIATAVGLGNANITVTINGVSAVATITVENVVVTQIIPEKTVMNIPYWKYVYTGVTLLPANATNINDWKVSSSNVLIVEAKKENNQIRLFGGKVQQKALITISCGQATATIDVTVANTASDVWLSMQRGGIMAGSVGMYIGSTRSLYVVTDPIDAVDKDNFTYTIKNPQCIDFSWNGDEFIFTSKNKGTCEVTVSINGFSNTTKIIVS